MTDHINNYCNKKFYNLTFIFCLVCQNNVTTTKHEYKSKMKYIGTDENKINCQCDSHDDHAKDRKENVNYYSFKLRT